MIKETTKFESSCLFEGMTSIRAVIAGIDSGVSDRRIERILFDKSRMPKIAKEIGYFKAVSQKYGFELVKATADELDKITLGSSHGGICAYCSERTYKPLEA